MKGEPVSGLSFFELLCADNGFCAELGRAVLAAGRLESSLKRYLAAKGLREDTTKATLGMLIRYAREHGPLSKMVLALEMVKEQRNYVAHNIHALLSDLISETILERNGLLDSDVHTYTERAGELKTNLNALAEIVERSGERKSGRIGC